MVGTVGMLDGAETVENSVNELLEDSVGSTEAAVDIVRVTEGPGLLASPVDELLEENVGNPDGAEEVPLR